jgi:hypothetical protein
MFSDLNPWMWLWSLSGLKSMIFFWWRPIFALKLKFIRSLFMYLISFNVRRP